MGRGGIAGQKRKSRSNKAGLQFPVARVGRYLKQALTGAAEGRVGKRKARGHGRRGAKGKLTVRMSDSAPVYTAAVLEYLTGNFWRFFCAAIIKFLSLHYFSNLICSRSA